MANEGEYKLYQVPLIVTTRSGSTTTTHLAPGRNPTEAGQYFERHHERIIVRGEYIDIANISEASFEGFRIRLERI